MAAVDAAHRHELPSAQDEDLAQYHSCAATFAPIRPSKRSAKRTREVKERALDLPAALLTLLYILGNETIH